MIPPLEGYWRWIYFHVHVLLVVLSLLQDAKLRALVSFDLLSEAALRGFPHGSAHNRQLFSLKSAKETVGNFFGDKYLFSLSNCWNSWGTTPLILEAPRFDWEIPLNILLFSLSVSLCDWTLILWYFWSHNKGCTVILLAFSLYYILSWEWSEDISLISWENI